MHVSNPKNPSSSYSTSPIVLKLIDRNIVISLAEDHFLTLSMEVKWCYMFLLELNSFYLNPYSYELQNSENTELGPQVRTGSFNPSS